jgi:amidase
MDLQSTEYKEALFKSQNVARAELDRLLKENQVIALIAPTTGPAWKTDLLNGDHFSGAASTLPAVAGYPHLSVPMGDVRGMPVGLSIITGQWQDREALQIGYAFEQLSKSRIVPRYLKDIP